MVNVTAFGTRQIRSKQADQLLFSIQHWKISIQNERHSCRNWIVAGVQKGESEELSTRQEPVKVLTLLAEDTAHLALLYEVIRKGHRAAPASLANKTPAKGGI